MQTSERQTQLSLRKTVRIAWKNIRVRAARSLILTGGVTLAISFLTYIMCTDLFVRSLDQRGSPELIQRLARQGEAGMDSELEAQSGEASEEEMATGGFETAWMVGLALLISFVGILNASLMSVTERFREIGTMKCLGALDALIVRLFLIESTFQGIVGTVIGIALGCLLAYLEGLRMYGAEVWVLVPLARVATTLGACFMAGTVLTIVGSVYPARRAALMKPVDAMRTEV